MKPYFFIVLLLCCSSCHPLCFEGLVLNEQDHPVAGATIRKNASHDSVNTKTLITDRNGRFCLETFQLGDTIYVQAAGYEPDTLIIEYYPKKQLTIALAPK